MSTEVFIQATRKSDGMPLPKFYLGGNGTRDEMITQFGNSEEVEDGYRVSEVKLPELKQMIEMYQDSFYIGNHKDELLNFIEFDNNDYKYWLLFEF